MFRYSRRRVFKHQVVDNSHRGTKWKMRGYRGISQVDALVAGFRGFSRRGGSTVGQSEGS